MDVVSDIEVLEQMRVEGALLILFGGAHCNVCHSIRTPLEQILKQRFERLRPVYIDCESSPDICAQYGVFSLPAVKVYIEGRLVAENAGVFGLNELMTGIERSYALWLGAGDEKPS